MDNLLGTIMQKQNIRGFLHNSKGSDQNPSVLGSKTINKNGVYYATDDNLDGYSSVNVNVLDVSYTTVESVVLAQKNITSVGYSTKQTYSKEIDLEDGKVIMVNAVSVEPTSLSSYKQYTNCYFKISGNIYYIPENASYIETNVTGSGGVVTGKKIVCKNAQIVDVNNTCPSITFSNGILRIV